MENSNEILTEEEKLKLKREKRNEIMRKYRAKKTEAYIKCRDIANKKYYGQTKEYRSKYQELLKSGIIEKLNTLSLESS